MEICSLDAQIKVFKVRRQFVLRHIMPTQKMRRNQDLRSLATVFYNSRTRFFVEVSAVENDLFNPNSFNPNSSKKTRTCEER